MSVRAYKVITIEEAENPTFNLWRDQDLMEALGSLITEQLSDYGDGYVRFSRDDIENIITGTTNEETKGKLKMILDDMGSDNEVLYRCY